MKEVIAVDIDDVLFDEHRSIRLFINDAYGLNLTEEHYSVEAPYWGYWKRVWNMGEEEGEEWFNAYARSGAKTQPILIPGAVEAIGRLKERYELVVISARDAPNHEATRVWLEDHFPNAFKSIEFVVAWYSDMKASKASIAKEVGASYLIDDSLHHCRDAAEAGVATILFGDYGYSRAYTGDHPLITRAYNWKEVEEFFDAKRG